MPGDSEKVTLREYIEQRFDASDKALLLSNQLLEVRLHYLNDLRGMLEDYTKTSITRSEYDAQHQRVVDDIKVLRESKAMLEGKASQLSVNITMAIAIIGIIVSLVTMFHR